MLLFLLSPRKEALAWEKGELGLYTPYRPVFKGEGLPFPGPQLPHLQKDADLVTVSDLLQKTDCALFLRISEQMKLSKIRIWNSLFIQYAGKYVLRFLKISDFFLKHGSANYLVYTQHQTGQYEYTHTKKWNYLENHQNVKDGPATNNVP